MSAITQLCFDLFPMPSLMSPKALFVFMVSEHGVDIFRGLSKIMLRCCTF